MTLVDRIEAIESAYEFMLAYAAQGQRGIEGGAVKEAREHLNNASAALEGLAEACRDAAAADNDGALDASTEFLAVLEQDAAKARAAIALALSRPALSSQLVDNLNASIHLRALLTDIFLIDEALKPVAKA